VRAPPSIKRGLWQDPDKDIRDERPSADPAGRAVGAACWARRARRRVGRSYPLPPANFLSRARDAPRVALGHCLRSQGEASRNTRPSGCTWRYHTIIGGIPQWFRNRLCIGDSRYPFAAFV